MKLISYVVFVLFLIHKSHGQTSSLKGKTGHVMKAPEAETSDYENLKQLPTEFIRDDLKHLVTRHEIPLGSAKRLIVKCVKHDDKVEAFVYGPEGYLLDVLKRTDVEGDCQQVKDHIGIIGEPNWKKKSVNVELSFTMTYEVSKNENDVVCASRQYTVTSINYYAKLDREGLKRMDCNKKTVVGTQYLSKNDWLLSSGTFDIRDFNKYGNPDDTPISYLLRYDPQLELKCQTYTMETKGWLKQKTTITASIIHEGIILEKLFLDSCTDEGIYIDKIGRYTYYNRHFTLEYKRKDKRCFIMGIDLAYNSPFKDVKVSRYVPQKFNCP